MAPVEGRNIRKYTIISTVLTVLFALKHIKTLKSFGDFFNFFCEKFVIILASIMTNDAQNR